MSSIPRSDHAPPSHPQADLLLVDLDAALLAARPRAEAAIAALRTNPRQLAQLGKALLHGRSEIAHFLDDCLAIYPATDLPVHEEVLTFLQEQQQAGHQLVFLTHLPRAWAAALLSQLGLAGQLLVSPPGQPATQQQKLALARQWCTQHDYPSPQVWNWDSPGPEWQPSTAWAGTTEHTFLLIYPPLAEVQAGSGRRWKPCALTSGSRTFSCSSRCW